MRRSLLINGSNMFFSSSRRDQPGLTPAAKLLNNGGVKIFKGCKLRGTPHGLKNSDVPDSFHPLTAPLAL